MRITNINIPLHTLNINQQKRVGDGQGWPIPRNLDSPHPDLKSDPRSQGK